MIAWLAPLKKKHGVLIPGPPLQAQAVDGGPERSPAAATCFDTLKLPRYQSEQQTRDRIITAITGAAGFDEAAIAEVRCTSLFSLLFGGMSSRSCKLATLQPRGSQVLYYYSEHHHVRINKGYTEQRQLCVRR